MNSISKGSSVTAEIKVSVIIPAYNTSPFIEKCLDNVISQSLKKIQIILVDDCSTDDTVRIINDYSSRDARIQVVCHETNQGLPAARNSGVNVARGKYLIHLDSDDFWCEDQMLEQLFELAEQRESEVVKFNGREYQNGKMGKQLAHIEPLQNAVLEGEKFLWRFRSAFLYFIRRDFVESNSIRFNSSISIGEDQIFVSKLLTLATRISTVDRNFYAYRINRESMMGRRWSINQFSEEARHSKIVMETLQNYPEILQHYSRRKMVYWMNQIFPRSFEELNKKDRLQFFEETAFFTRSFDVDSLHKNASLKNSAVLFLQMMNDPDKHNLEAGFREKVNSSFSISCPTNLKTWPAYSLVREELGSPSPAVEGTIYIHAGTHKTGSTAVQKFLQNNRKQLADDGFFYCEAAGMWGPNSHLLPVSLVDSAEQLLGWPSMDPDRIWENILIDYHNSGCRDLLLSSEFFSPEYLSSELPNLDYLRALIGRNCVKFIFYIRPQDERLESGYAQLVRSGVRAIGESFEEYLERAKKSQDYQWLLAEYEKTFGREALIVRRYSRSDFDGKNICRDFLSALDIQPSAYLFLDSEANETWAKNVIGFLQETNRHPNNTLSMAQKDRFSHYVHRWFKEHNQEFVDHVENRLCPEMREILAEYYRESNLVVSERYLEPGKPLSIRDFLPSANPSGNRELPIDDLLKDILLDCWAQKDELDGELAWWRKRSSTPSFRKWISMGRSKARQRIKAEAGSVRKWIFGRERY